MLSAAELEALRGDMAAALPDTCVISRAAGTANAAGFVGRTYAPVGTAACRLDPVDRASARDVVALRENTVRYRQLTVPHDADLRAGDRVGVGGQAYAVMRLDDDHSLRAVRRALIVRA